MKASGYLELWRPWFWGHEVIHIVIPVNTSWSFQDIFLGEVLGAVYMVQGSNLEPSVKVKPVSIVANTTESTDGQIFARRMSANQLKILYNLNNGVYYNHLANSLANDKQSAVVGSFEEQKAIWSRPQKQFMTNIAKDMK